MSSPRQNLQAELGSSASTCREKGQKNFQIAPMVLKPLRPIIYNRAIGLVWLVLPSFVLPVHPHSSIDGHLSVLRAYNIHLNIVCCIHDECTSEKSVFWWAGDAVLCCPGKRRPCSSRTSGGASWSHCTCLFLLDKN